MFQKVYAFHPSLQRNWFLKECLQTQTFLYRFEQDHITHDLLFPAIPD
jgi:hypothetical protein